MTSFKVGCGIEVKHCDGTGGNFQYITGLFMYILFSHSLGRGIRDREVLRYGTRNNGGVIRGNFVDNQYASVQVVSSYPGSWC